MDEGGRKISERAQGNTSAWQTCNYDAIEKLANAVFRGRINATDRLFPIIKVLKQWELQALTSCERVHARINNTRICPAAPAAWLFDAVLPAVNRMSVLSPQVRRRERREEVASPHGLVPFPWIFYACNPLFPLVPWRQCTMGRTLVIGQQIQNGIR